MCAVDYVKILAHTRQQRRRSPALAREQLESTSILLFLTLALFLSLRVKRDTRNVIIMEHGRCRLLSSHYPSLPLRSQTTKE
mmetsp:Transcript_2519/g.7953  ORF Transcript_2519/g.7953 Transcript_2519/m.7953 type:complete len:82 (+) Transcript_2519:702-947(+)